MKEQLKSIRFTITLGVLAAAALLYIWFTSSDKVVINEHGKINGYINVARELLQGNNFWEDQYKCVQKELQWELGEPERQAKFEKSMQKLDEKINHDIDQFYEEHPDLRPSQATQKAEALRKQADAIEMAELNQQLETMRQKRISELRKIQEYLEKRR